MGQSAVRRSRAEIPLPAPYHGLHVALPQKGYERIKWMSPTGRSDRVRVRRHTCECRATIYELCHSGGVFFIRRTIRSSEKTEIHETERLISARMEDLWNRLIVGQAR